MSRREREIAKQRARLMAVESNGMSEIVRSYQQVLRRLNADLDAVTAKIEEARQKHVRIGPSWLTKQARYQSLIAQHEQLTLGFLRDSLESIEGVKGRAINLAGEDAPRATIASLGPAPKAARTFVEDEFAASFSRLPERQIDRLVRFAADGKPLGRLLAEAATEATRKVKDALVSGVARGAGVRDIASDVRKASGIAQNRALLISRTEVIRAYRQTNFDLYKESDVVKGWVWLAEVNACPVCSAETGSEHTLDETLDSHPGCRCTAVPQTVSWRDLGFNVPDGREAIETGEQRFASLSKAEQLAAIGRARLDAYNAGDITLQDMVRDTRSKRWGKGKRTASLAELGI